MGKRKILTTYFICYMLLFGVILFISSWFLQWTFFVVTEPEIKFDENTIVELNTPYKNKYTATYLGQDVSSSVVVDNNVDITKVGEYNVTYTLIINHQKVVKQRIVKVVDKTPPIITLTGLNPAIVCPGKTYIEAGYKATDDYNGDLSNKVTVILGVDKITYSVSDLSGNTITVERNINYADVIAPTILLKGNAKIYVYLGASYSESGYKASDNCDGDISSKVTVSGSVNTSKLGTYTLTYSVTDTIGLKATVTRTVVVISKPNNSGKTIYLTFDDGPSNVTSSILDILKSEGVKATFFVINRSDSYNYLIARAYSEGHTVALHCYSHNYETVYASDTAYFNDLSKISYKVKAITGVESKIIRFPGGSSNSTSRNYSVGIMTRLTAEVTRRGYVYFDWNVGSTDTQNIGANQVYQNVTSRLSSGSTSIVLMHDAGNNWQSVNALRRIIQYGKEYGYSFNKITTSTPAIHHRVTN